MNMSQYGISQALIWNVLIRYLPGVNLDCHSMAFTMRESGLP